MTTRSWRPHKSTVMLGVRLRPAVVEVFRRRAAKQGRSLNEYMAFWLTDEAYRNHHGPEEHRSS